MRPVLRLGCTLAVFVLTAVPVWSDEPYRVIYPKGERHIQTVLAEPASFDFAGTLREALAGVAKEHGVPIVVNEVSIRDYGIDLEQPVDHRVKGISVATLLELLLEPADLGYVVGDDALKIVPRELAERKPLVRAYDVTGMLGPDATAEIISQAVQPIVLATAEGPVVGVVQIVPFRNRLIVVADRGGHAAVVDALDIMSQEAAE